jgi:hypothetical protein
MSPEDSFVTPLPTVDLILIATATKQWLLYPQGSIAMLSQPLNGG